MRQKLSSILAAGLLGGAMLGGTINASADPAGAMVGNPCAGCHGIDGASQGQAPVIAGLNAMYLDMTMKAYRDGQRYATIMDRIAKGYTDEQIAAMSKFFGDKSWPANTQSVDADAAAKGQKLHMSTGCVGCHGQTGVAMMPNVPRLAGQYAGFLNQQMLDYKDAGKAIPPTAMVMRSMLSGLSDEDIAALAAFYASQK